MTTLDDINALSTSFDQASSLIDTLRTDAQTDAQNAQSNAQELADTVTKLQDATTKLQSLQTIYNSLLTTNSAQYAEIADLKAQIAALQAQLGPKLPSGYTKLVLNEEFKGTALNTKIWNVRDAYTAGNEYAARRAQNVIVNDGLVIQPKRESYMGRTYTSGEIYTDGKFSWTGPFRIDTWASLPHKPNVSSVLWPAIWLRAASGAGEIDIMEAWGTKNALDNDPTNNSQGKFSGHIFSDTGTGAGVKGQWMAGVSYTPPFTTPVDLTTEHKYSLACAADGSLTWLFDDKTITTFSSATYKYLNPNDPTFAFKGGYTLRLTLQIGQKKNGAAFWYGAPIDSALDLTQQYKVRQVLISQP